MVAATRRVPRDEYSGRGSSVTKRKMKRVYLFFATVIVVVVCKENPTSNDVIWYPVDDDENVFISTLGEKRKSPTPFSWRSQRRARYSGFDPTENQDPSFFHNIHERRPLVSKPFSYEDLPPFHSYKVPIRQPNQPLKDRPSNQVQMNQNNFQEIINEIFDTNKHPPIGEFPGEKPQAERPPQWGNGGGGTLGNQWSGRPTNNEWYTRPTGNQGGDSVQRPGGRPQPQRPTDSEWINRPNTRPMRKPNESDKLVFPGEVPTSRPTSTESLLPTEAPPLSPCERRCPVTPQFNPVCGSDMITYSNIGRLKCAQSCGKDVQMVHHGSCGRPRFVTPLLKDPTGRIGFW